MTGFFNNPRRHLRTLIKQARKEKDSIKREKKYDEALEYGHGIEKKLEHDPDIAFIIGTVYFMNGDIENTLSYMNKTLEIGEYDIDALSIKASVYLHLKKTDQVKECCEKIQEIDPKNKALKEIKQIFANYNFKKQILVASVRHPQHVIEAAKTGADVVTLPPAVLGKMLGHALTDKGLKAFLADWEKLQSENSSK